MDLAQHELLARIASMYYEDEMTQNAIAKALGLSRVKIYRLLKQARETGVVRISIDYPIKRDTTLEDQLTETFHLSQALVLNGSLNDSAGLRMLGRLAASYLEQLLHDSPTMAICLGRSTFEVINAVDPDYQANVQVAQAIGSVPDAPREYDSSALARQLAEKLGGTVRYLSSPPMADTSEAAEIISSQREIERTLQVARTADVALIGIGNLDPERSGFVRANLLTQQEIVDLRQGGAVGDIAWRIFNVDGEPHPCEFNERIIGITLDDLKRIPNTVAIAGGLEKSAAIHAALRSGVLNVLCVDAETARHILEQHEQEEAMLVNGTS